MKSISLLLSLFIGLIGFAQNDFEGTITTKIEYEDLAEEMEMMKSMLPAESTTEIKDGIAKTETNSAISNMIIYNDINTNKSLLLNNAMGNKFATWISPEESKKQVEELNVEIEFTEETKEILGYSCKKAIVSSEGSSSEVYYTTELPNFSTNGQPNSIPGFALQTTMETDFFTVVSTVTEIKKEKVKKIKMQVPSDYTVKTIEELKKMQGGM